MASASISLATLLLREIVGVVANSVVNEVGENPQPIVFLPMTQDYAPAATLQVRTTGNPEGVVATTRAALQSLDPNLAITNVFTIEQILSQALWAPRMGGFLLALFGGARTGAFRSGSLRSAVLFG